MSKENVNTKENSPYAVAMPPFNYSSKVIISVSDYESKKNVKKILSQETVAKVAMVQKIRQR